MFLYDAALAAALGKRPESIAEVIAMMETVEATCAEGDGLRWFNWLYLRVTRAVETRIAAGGISDPAWLAELDVQFSRFYFRSIRAALGGNPAPGCWQALMRRRNDRAVARLQFALAGVNAHINHDLPLALVATCEAAGIQLEPSGRHYDDYTALNSTFESLINEAKATLRVRLLGDALPPAAHLENTIAAWKVTAAREAAWRNGGLYWHLRSTPPLGTAFLQNLDGFTTVASKALLVAVA